MFKKSIAFGLLAATLMVAPGAAFADQSQSNDQYTEQNGAALDGSINSQNSTSNNRQSQDKYNGVYRGRYNYGRCGTDSGDQDQSSRQTTVQNGAAENGSINSQNSRTNSNQRQSAFNSRYCR